MPGELIRTFATVAASQTLSTDDDGIDRLNHRYTVIILIIFSIIVSTKQYVGEPISCWCYDSCREESHVEYMNKVCWVKNTYYYPIRRDLPLPGTEETNNLEISYYQWVPLILLAQAILFYIPGMIWRSFNRKSGITIQNIIDAAEMFQSTLRIDEKDKIAKHVTRYIDNYLDHQQIAKTIFGRLGCFTSGRYVSILYLITKLLYVANTVVQLVLLDSFLGSEYGMYGFKMIRGLISGVDQINLTPGFPTITMCDFDVRKLGAVHNYRVQCVLPINLFNEKIFIFIWFWLVITAILTCINFVLWFFALMLPLSRYRFIKKHLRLAGKYSSATERRRCREFVSNFIMTDGVLILHLISKNSSDIITSQIVGAMWENYRQYKPFMSEYTDGEI
ncbi:innexin unc-7-like [Octopus sinensis]|uniref:Innexin n=1 Tax=Octopus sinensis TaxID=2607531 RepID=A0A6P7TS66_9MOLL|nr:innexin unc-7-like [Octopus sinensis]